MAKINVSVSSSSSKPNVTVSKGPVGPQGEQGIQGEVGPQGVEGVVSSLESVPNVQIPSGGYVANPDPAGFVQNMLTFDPQNNRWTTFQAAAGNIETAENKAASPPPSNLWTDPIITVDFNEANSIGTTRLALNNSNYIPNDVNLYVNGPSRFNGSVEIASGGSTVYSLPSADGTANQILKTDGSGATSFTSNYMDLDGTQVISGAKFFTATPVLTNGLQVNAGGINVTGASQLGSATFSGSLSAQQLTFVNNGTSIIAPTTSGGLLPEDLEVRSNGNILIKLDTDNNESAQKFIVVDYNDVERFSVQEDGVVRVSNAYNLPSADGTAGQFLKTDGSGNISFAAASSLALGTTSTTALAGDTTTISTAQASEITANTAKISYTDASAVAANTAKISYTDASAVAANTAKVGSQWTTATNDIYYTTGNVGIGTTTPAQPLHVNGTIRTVGSSGYSTDIVTHTNGGLSIGENISAIQSQAVNIGRSMGRFNGGTKGVLIGHQAGYRGSYSHNQVAIGSASNSGGSAYSKTNAIGIGSDSNYNGSNYTTSVGASTGRNSPSSYTNSSFFGYAAGHSGGNNSVFVGYEAGKSDGVQTVDNTVAVGYQALTALTTGANNTAVGHQASSALTTASNNTALGYSASAIGGNSLAIGSNALANNTRSIAIGHDARAYTYDIIAIGDEAGPRNNTGNPSSSVWIGRKSGNSNTGNGNGSNVGVGHQAGRFNNSQYNVFVGNGTGYHGGQGFDTWLGAGAGSTSGGGSVISNTVAVGYQANPGNAVGGVTIGYQAGNGTATNPSVAVGYQALTALTTGAGNTAVGYQAGLAQTTAGNNTVLGYQAGLAMVAGGNNTIVGASAGKGLSSGGAGQSNNVFIGSGAAEAVASTSSSIAIGHNAAGGTSASNNSYSYTIIGADAASYNTSGQTHSNAVIIGKGAALTSGVQGATVLVGAGTNRFGGSGTVALGYAAAGNAGGDYNVAIGWNSTLGTYNTPSSTKTLNVVIGKSTGAALLTGGNNVFLGSNSGSALTSGSSNVFIGDSAGGAVTTGSNKLYIENSNSSTPLIYGEFDNDILRVNGTLQVNDPASTGYALPAATGTTGQALVVNTSGDVEFGDVGVDGFTTTEVPKTSVLSWQTDQLISSYSSNSNSLGYSDAEPCQMVFTPDGTKMFFVGRNQNKINQQTLSTPWDLSTITNTNLVQFTVPNTASGSEGDRTGLWIAHDPNDTSTYGKKFYTCGLSKARIQEFTASTAWDLSTLSSTADNDIYVGGETNTEPWAITFNADGSKMYVLNGTSVNPSASPGVVVYNLSTNWDISTAVYSSSESSTLTVPEGRLSGIQFVEDGSIMYLVASNGHEIYEYSLSTAYDVTTATLTSSIDIQNEKYAVGQTSNWEYPGGIWVSDDYVFVSIWHQRQIIFRMEKGGTSVSEAISFAKHVEVDGHLESASLRVNGIISSNAINTGGGTIGTSGRVDFGSLYNSGAMFVDGGRFELFDGRIKFSNSFNQSTGTELLVEENSLGNASGDPAALYTVTIPAKTGTVALREDDRYYGAFDSNAKTKLNSATEDLEFYYTARSDGNGQHFHQISETPASGQTITRAIYYSDKALADPNTAGDWTQLTSYSGVGDSSTTSKTEALNQLNNRTVGTTPMSLKTVITNANSTSFLRDAVFGEEMELAFSLRLVNPMYTGAAIRVINDSSVEADIGFDSNLDLDSSALLAHCGSGDGYILKWYDQSKGGATGSGNDATTDLSASWAINRPQIVSSGSVITQNSKPAIYANDSLMLFNEQSYLGYGLPWQMTYVATRATTNVDGNSGMLIGTYTKSTVWERQNSGIDLRLQDASNTSLNFSNEDWTSQRLMTIYRNTDNEVYLRRNADPSSFIDSAWTTNSRVTWDRIFNSWNNKQYAYDGNVQEIVYWKTYDASKLSSAESNINTYYSIY